ncbi:hypothetical protein C0J52_19964 [Blattella germanica]|nr:hypothetical protein C0J52_19964 [Blattella germanica]
MQNGSTNDLKCLPNPLYPTDHESGSALHPKKDFINLSRGKMMKCRSESGEEVKFHGSLESSPNTFSAGRCLVVKMTLGYVLNYVFVKLFQG